MSVQPVEKLPIPTWGAERVEDYLARSLEDKIKTIAFLIFYSMVFTLSLGLWEGCGFQSFFSLNFVLLGIVVATISTLTFVFWPRGKSSKESQPVCTSYSYSQGFIIIRGWVDLESKDREQRYFSSLHAAVENDNEQAKKSHFLKHPQDDRDLIDGKMKITRGAPWESFALQMQSKLQREHLLLK